MFYDILVERYQTYQFNVEAHNQAEAERIGREQFAAFDPATSDVTVQARATAFPGGSGLEVAK